MVEAIPSEVNMLLMSFGIMLGAVGFIIWEMRR